MAAFSYNAITTDSNFAPISLELRDGRTGQSVNLTGATISVTVRDELTLETIVEDSAGSVNTANPAIVEFYFALQDVAKITRPSTWLVEWKVIAANARVYRTPEPMRLPVRPKL
jgi:hypothetical protein